MTFVRPHLGCRFASALAIAGALCLSAHALAQIQRLPEGLSTASELSSKQEQQIREFVKAQFARLTSGDVTDIEEARNSLESPFTDRKPPSIAFRLVYGGQVAIETGPLLQPNHGHTDVRVNALLVAGECGTRQTVDLLGDVLSGKRGKMSPTVRAAAVTALHNVIREADAGHVRREQGEKAVTLVAQALAKANNATFATTCVIALSSTERQPLHAKAAEQLADALPQLAASLRNTPKIEDADRWEQAMQLGLRLIQVHILQAAGGPLDPALMKASVEAAAQALGFVVTRFEDVGPAALNGTDEQTRLVGLTDQADKLMQLAGQSVPGLQSGLADKLNQAITNGDDDTFLDATRATARWVQRVTGKEADAYGL